MHNMPNHITRFVTVSLASPAERTRIKAFQKEKLSSYEQFQVNCIIGVIHHTM